MEGTNMRYLLIFIISFIVIPFTGCGKTGQFIVGKFFDIIEINREDPLVEKISILREDIRELKKEIREKQSQKPEEVNETEKK